MLLEKKIRCILVAGIYKSTEGDSWDIGGGMHSIEWHYH